MWRIHSVHVCGDFILRFVVETKFADLKFAVYLTDHFISLCRGEMRQQSSAPWGGHSKTAGNDFCMFGRLHVINLHYIIP